MTTEITAPTGNVRSDVLTSLKLLIDEVLPNVHEDDLLQRPFLEMGANSLVLMELQKMVEEQWGLELKLPMFFEELTNLEALIDFVELNGKKRIAKNPNEDDAESQTRVLTLGGEQSGELSPRVGLDSGPLQDLLTAQIQGATVAMNALLERQLGFLKENFSTSDYPNAASKQSKTVKGSDLSGLTATRGSFSESRIGSNSTPAIRPQTMLRPLEIRARGLTDKQHRHLENLIERYTRKTARSKRAAECARSALADSRASVGFRFTTKEMLYPIVGARSAGSKIWDIDDNEYVDITMGQGVTLFGHHPPFIDEAVRGRATDSMELGPRPPEAAEAANLIAEMSGMERVTFTNSGTEAVMAAIRLARAATGRNKIVTFVGSYHGHADNVMGIPNPRDPLGAARPASSGIPEAAVQDLIILEYGEESALEAIRLNQSEIAAVVVEPVQSRRPDLQPREFLHDLRALTTDIGAILVFDEMITGFRVHQRGAQGWFDVQADIATYGKVVGGGMPIGVVAGRNGLMDPIDGGVWSYGDSSYPEVERVIFGGTFCQHPLVMASTLATLRHLKEQGPGLQQTLNQRTNQLKERLNRFFQDEEMPIAIVNFGSLFRFDFKENLELLFYHLMEKGVFIWEWRNYFLSTAHSEADIDFVAEQICESALELRRGGFLSGQVSDPGKQVHAQCGDVHFKLSDAQNQLLTLSRLTGVGSKAYQVGGTVELDGTLSFAKLSSAYRQAVDDHQALFCLPRDSKDRTSRRVSPPDLELVGQYTAFSDPNLQAWLDQPMDIDFDLETGPLIRAFAAKVQDKKVILRIVAHHFIFDGISMNLLFRDIVNRYGDEDSDKSRGGVGKSFGEYLAYMDTQVFEKEREFWIERLANLPRTLNFPRDVSESARKSFRCHRFTYTFEHDKTRQLKQQAASSGCTEFMYFFALYAAWLRRLTNAEEFILGVPVTGRPSREFNETLGYFTHLLPIRIDSSSCQSDSDFIAVARRSLLEAYEHQSLPYSEIIKLLGPKITGLGDEPLIRALFNFDQPGELKGPLGTKARWLPTPAGYTAFGMICNVTVSEENYFIELSFEADRISKSLANELGEGFVHGINQTLLSSSGIHFPRDAVSEHSIRRQLDCFEKGPGCAISGHVLPSIESVFLSNPDSVAIEQGDEFCTFRELQRRSTEIVERIHQLEVPAQSRVVVSGVHSIDLVAVMIGVMRAGLVLVPVDPSIPQSRKEWICKDSDAALIFVDEILNEWRAVNAKQVLISTGVIDPSVELVESTGTNNSNRQTADSAYILYTSGSTGNPKGVIISQRAFANYVSWAADYYDLRSGSGAVFHGSIGFDATLTSIFPPLSVGQRIIIPLSSRDPIDGIASLVRARRSLSLLKLTPTHLELLNANLNHQIPNDSVQCLVLGGEALKGEAISEWHESPLSVRVINEYGPTETVVGCCVYEVPNGNNAGGPVPIGRPIQNVGLRVIDPEGNFLPIGVVGELFIYGESVGDGYLNQKLLTDERFVSIPGSEPGKGDAKVRGYLTGDLVRWDNAGNLHYLGRKDEQIKLRGFRIEPEEIESAINGFPGVQQSAVCLVNHEDGDERLIGFIVEDRLGHFELNDLRKSLVKKLPTVMIPSELRVIDSLPTSVNGKVERKILVNQLLAETSSLKSGPMSSHEQQVGEVWRAVLKIEIVPPDTNFFDLGGHSILVLKLVESLNARFSSDLKPLDIYEKPTVRLIAERLGFDSNSVKDPAEEAQATRRGAASRQQRNNSQFATGLPAR